MWNTLWAVLASVALAHCAVITSVAPNEGSLVGGTIVRISGTGFERGGVEGTTTVTFGPSECVTIDYHSSDTIITCIAPASAHETDNYASVAVTLIQVDSASTASCTTDCRFRYRSSSTPSLYGFFSDFVAGQLATVYGLVRGSELSQFDIRVGDTVCDLEDADNDEPVSSTDTLFCTPNEQPAGRYDLSVRVDKSASDFGYGLARIDNNTRHYDLTTGRPYHVTVRPAITGVSSSTAGLSGGSAITIEGSGFNPSDLASNVVHLDGVVCAVTEVTDTSVTCTTGARTDTTAVTTGYHRGPAGTLAEVWTDSTTGSCLSCAYSDDARYPDSPSLSQTTSQGATSISGGEAVNAFWGNNYFQRSTAYFVAPATATYSFGMVADDVAELYLSSDETQDTASRISYLNSWTDDWYNGKDQQWSDPVALTQGQRYFMDYRFAEGGGGDFISIGVRVHGADSWVHDGALWHSPREKQSFSFSSTAAYEVQTLTLTGATSGTFVINYPASDDPRSTDPLAFDASAADVKSALNDIRRFEGCNSIDVTRDDVTGPPAGYAWHVTFNCPLRSDYPQLAILNDPSDPLSPPETLSVDGTRTPSGNWLSGTFRLSIDGGTEFTGDIDIDSSWWQVRNALQALSSVPSVSVKKTGSSLSGPTWTVLFNNNRGDIPDFVVDSTLLTGDGVAFSTLEILKGDDSVLQLLPIPTDWLEVPSALPAIELWVSGFKATCDAPARVPTTASGSWPAASAASATHCNFVYDAALVPTVTDVSPVSATEGAVLTVTGTGFETALAETPVVTFGGPLTGIACAVTAWTDTSITCTLGRGPAGDHAIAVHAGINGVGTNDAGLADLTYTLSVSTASPVVGSTQGGSRVTLVGSGLASDTVVTVDGSVCAVDATVTDSNTLVCVTSAHAPASGLAIVAGTITLSETYEYATTHTPTVTTFTPTVTSAAITTPVSLTLANVNYAVSASSPPVVTFGSAGQEVPCVSVAFTQDIPSGGAMTITCELLRGAVPAAPQPASQPVAVYIEGLGLADVSGAPSLDRRLNVVSVTPNDISLVGGAVLTITGHGFAGHAHMNTVTLHDHPGAADVATCHVLTASSTSLTCKVHTHHSPASLTASASSVDTSSGHSHGRRLTAASVAAAAANLPGKPAGRDANFAAVMNMLEDAGTAALPMARVLSTSEPAAGTATVTVNELASVCEAVSGDCVVDLTVASTPTVTEMGVLPAGAGFQVTGTGLTPAAGSTILFGTASCDVDTGASSATQLVCSTFPLEPASTSPVQVMLADKGYADITSSTVNYTFPLTMTSLSVTSGSASGGSTTVLTGTGFVPTDVTTYSGVPATMTVMVGGVEATVHHATTTTIMFDTPSHSTTLAAGETTTAPVMVSVSSGWDGHTDSFTAMLPDAWTFDGDLTPFADTITPANGARDTPVVIAGTGFGATQGGSTVVVGEGAPCVVTAWSDTSIECTVGDAPAGRNQVVVDVENKGFATQRSGLAFTAGLTVGTLSSTSGGFGGGQSVTLDGAGFKHGRTHVMVCGQHATVTAATYDSVTFSTPQLDTRGAIDTFTHRLPGSIVGDWVSSGVSTSTRPRLADNDFESYVSGSRDGCWYGYDFGEHARGVVERIRVYARIRYQSRAAGSVIEGSDDATTWTPIAAFGDNMEAGWNWVDVADPATVPAYRYVRYAAADDSYCQLAELQFMGYSVSAYDDGVCSVAVMVSAEPHSPYAADAATMQPVTGSYTYSSGTTSKVTAVSPDQGTALGGTELTITGSGFDTDHTRVTVTVNGVDCPVSASTLTTITCTTGPRGTQFRDFTLEVTSPVTGTALLDAATRSWFRYLDRWSSLSTWANNEPPVAGDTVVIPHGQAVLLDVSPPELLVLLVQGMLVFDHDAATELKLDATYIFIFGGVFEIGTEARPFMGDATVTLHGDRWTTIELPSIGAKTLAATDYPFVVHDHSGSSGGHGMTHAHSPDFRAGVLDIHGAPRIRSWVKLDADVPVGGTTLTLGEPTDWGVGDVLIVTSSQRGAGVAQVEEVTVTAVSSPTSVTISPPLAYARTATVVDYAGWTPVDMRPEVGLLSRNVIIQGDAHSDSQLFGVHTMALHAATYRVEGAEIRRCGQSGVLGRYCTHFHMMGSRPDNYVRNNAIHHSFQRAVTVHATNDVQVAHNVAYHVRGHTYFVEDGNEERSFFDENLGVKTLKHAQLLKSDTKPATFWTPTPKCIWRNNVAAGSAAHGFWFELQGHPSGPSFTPTMCPNKDAVGGFGNNTFHSNSANGLRVYPFWQPHVDPCDATSDPDPQYLHDLTSWRNGGHGVFHRDVGSLHHMRYKLVENGGNEIFWKKLKGTNGMRHVSHYQDTLAIGSLDPAAPKTWTSAVWGPQTEYWFVGPMTFVNYGTGVLRGCANCDSQTALAQGGYTFRFTGLTFDNSPVRTSWTAPFKQIFWDLDGSLTGTPDGMVSPYWAFNDQGPSGPCTSAGAAYDNGIVCDATARLRRMQVDHVEPRELDFQRLDVTGALGADTAAVPFRPKELYGWVFPVVGGSFYHLHFDSLVDWQTMKLRYSEPAYLAAGEWVGVSSDFIDHRHEMEVMYGADWRPPLLDRLPTSADEHGVGAMGNVHDGVDNKTWHVVLSTNNAYHTDDEDQFAFEVSALQCPRLIGCPLPAPPALADAKMWSDPTAWPSGAVPVAGEAVVITNTMHIVLDVDPPKLGQIRVEGRLEFGDLRSTTLECDAIVVLGSMYVGTESRPYYHEARIVLHGIRTSPSVVVDSAHFLGNKNIAVFGELVMVGRAPTVAWTKLAAPAAAGDAVLTLSESIEGSWFAGQQIVLTPTEYDASEVEVVTIVAVRDAGLTVDVSPALTHSHYHGTIPAPGGDVTLAAAVGLLYRNVVVEGADPDASTQNYGGHMFVSEINREVDDGAGGTVTRAFVGTALLRGVQLDHFGKMGTEHPGVRFKYTQAHDPPLSNTVDRVAFSNAYNYGIVTEKAVGLQLLGNVVHGGHRSSFDLDKDSTGAVIVGNLVAGTYHSPDFLGEWLEPIAAFFIDNTPAEFRGNLATGSHDAGFTIQAPPCSSDAYSSGKWGGNEAVSVKVGAFLLSRAPDAERCVQWNDFTVWKAAHVGVLSVDMESNLRLDNLMASDNHIGVSLNFFGGADTGNEARISNSLIMGSTPASASCTASSECLAMTEADAYGTSCGSVLGSTWRRAGILTSQWTNRGKTCEVDGRHGGGLPVCRPPNRPERLCGLPWEKRYGLPSNNEARMTITGTAFAYWATLDCGKKSAALVHNPSQIDWTPPIHVSGVSWDTGTVEESAKMYFGTAIGAPGTCVTGQCDSYNFGIIRDEDGSLTGEAAGTTLIPNSNPSIAAEAPACAEDIEKGVFVCPAVQNLRPMVMRDRDRNSQTRRLGPIVITREDPVYGNETYYSIGPHDDGCAKRFFFPRYPWLISPGYHYRMRASQTLPSHTRFYFSSDNTADSAVIALFLQKPNKVEMIVDGVKKEPQTTIPTLTDPAGTHVFDPHARHVYFVVRGGATRYDLIRTPFIQLNIKLAISIEEFFGDDLVSNIATLLRIRPEQIKVVDVHAGSVEVEIEIVDDAPTAVEEDDQDEQFERLTAIGTTITELVQDDAFDVGYELAEVPSLFVPELANPVDEPVPVVIPPKPSPSPSASPTPGLSPPSSNSLSVGLVAGVVVATFCVGAFAAFLLFRWKRASKARGHKVRDEQFHLDNPMHRGKDGTLRRIEVQRSKDGTIRPNRAALPSPKSGVKPSGSANGWSKFWDSGHKRFYWYHAQTSVSQWTAPTGWTEPARSHDWHMVWDDTSQRPYFYNSETGETTFKTPLAVKEEQRKARRKETGMEDDPERLTFGPARPRVVSGAVPVNVSPAGGASNV